MKMYFKLILHTLLIVILLVSDENHASSLPELESKVLFQSNSNELLIEQIILQRLRYDEYVLNDTIIQDIIERKVSHIVQFTQLYNLNVHPVIINDIDLNAFTYSQGLVGINTGALRYLTDESQFAAVVSHELAHLVQKHHLRKKKNDAQNFFGSLVGAIATWMIISASGSSDINSLAISSGVFSEYLMKTLSFSRKMETEADNFGIDILVKSGYSALGMMNAHKSIKKKNQYMNHFESFQSHPFIDKRIINAGLKAKQYEDKKGIENTFIYQLMLARLQILKLDSDSDLLTKLRLDLTTKTGEQLHLTWYSLALFHSVKHQYQTANKYVDILLNKYPNNPYFIIEKAHIERKQNLLTSANKRMNDLVEKFPLNYPVLMELASIQIELNQLDKAEKTVNKLIKSRPSDPEVWKKRAQIYEKSKNKLEYIRCMAEIDFLLGRVSKAIKRFEYIQTLTKNKITLAKINYRLKSMRQYLINVERLQKS